MNRRQMLGAMGLMAAGGAAFVLPASAQKDSKSGARIFDVKEFGAAEQAAQLGIEVPKNAVTLSGNIAKPESKTSLVEI